MTDNELMGQYPYLSKDLLVRLYLRSLKSGDSIHYLIECAVKNLLDNYDFFEPLTWVTLDFNEAQVIEISRKINDSNSQQNLSETDKHDTN